MEIFSKRKLNADLKKKKKKKKTIKKTKLTNKKTADEKLHKHKSAKLQGLRSGCKAALPAHSQLHHQQCFLAHKPWNITHEMNLSNKTRFCSLSPST